MRTFSAICILTFMNWLDRIVFQITSKEFMVHLGSTIEILLKISFIVLIIQDFVEIKKNLE